MKIFKPHESFIIRHKILQVLFESSQKEKDEQRPINRVSISQIAKQTGINRDKIFIYHELLHEKKEINCKYDCSDPKDHFMIIETEGRQSYIYEKYLKEGKLEAKNEIKDKVAIFAPIASFSISIISIIIAILSYQNSNNKNNQEVIIQKTKTQIESPNKILIKSNISK